MYAITKIHHKNINCIITLSCFQLLQYIPIVHIVLIIKARQLLKQSSSNNLLIKQKIVYI